MSAWLFLLLFLVSLPAELIANDRPAFVWFDGHPYFPAFVTYPETTFGGDFPTEADYRDPYVAGIIAEKGFAVWPPIPFSYRTVITDLGKPAPSHPDRRNLLAPTIRPATCWPGSSTASAPRCCSGWR